MLMESQVKFLPKQLLETFKTYKTNKKKNPKMAPESSTVHPFQTSCMLTILA